MLGLLLYAALNAPEHAELTDELSDQLNERKEKRQQSLARARSELVGDNFDEAVLAFTEALELTVAGILPAALRLAVSGRWKPREAPRVELADMYSGRGLARIRLGQWIDALKDAHAAAFLAPGSRDALSLLAAASAGVASMPQEPVSFFLDDPMPGSSDEEALRLATNMTGRLGHALVADVFSMLTEGLDESDPEHRAALASRDAHVGRSSGLLHPLGRRVGGASASEAFTMMTMAVESLAVAPFDTRTNTPTVALLAQTLLSVTAFRLGCREPPLQWRPKHLLGVLREDRLLEVWLRSRIEGEGDAPALRAGQRVRLAGLATRADLNGELGEVLSYDKLKDRYSVQVGEKRLRLKARNLVAEPEPIGAEKVEL